MRIVPASCITLWLAACGPIVDADTGDAGDDAADDGGPSPCEGVMLYEGEATTACLNWAVEACAAATGAATCGERAQLWTNGVDIDLRCNWLEVTSWDYPCFGGQRSWRCVASLFGDEPDDGCPDQCTDQMKCRSVGDVAFENAVFPCRHYGVDFKACVAGIGTDWCGCL